MEPIHCTGDLVNFPADYSQAIRKMCDKLGMLLIWDDIQTGFGCVADWFGANVYKTVPDILIIGKGLRRGFPRFGMLLREDPAPFHPGDHFLTLTHFLISTAVALATVVVTESEGLLSGRADWAQEFHAC
jgi:4-aminobutyrate aminotransferase-like enzyme